MVWAYTCHSNITLGNTKPREVGTYAEEEITGGCQKGKPIPALLFYELAFVIKWLTKIQWVIILCLHPPLPFYPFPVKRMN
jgi:hypothetical protein